MICLCAPQPCHTACMCLCLICILTPCACVLAEDERGDHLREFLSDPEQDLEGFDDLAAAGQADQTEQQGSATDDGEGGGGLGEQPAGADDSADQRAQDEAAAESTELEDAAMREAADVGVDAKRDSMRPPLVAVPGGADADGADADGEGGEGGVGEGGGGEGGAAVDDEGAKKGEPPGRRSHAEGGAVCEGDVLEIEIGAKERWLGTVVQKSATADTQVAVMRWFDGSADMEIILAGSCCLQAAVLGAVRPLPQSTIHARVFFCMCVQARMRSVGRSLIRTLSTRSSRIWVRQRPQSYLQVIYRCSLLPNGVVHEDLKSFVKCAVVLCHVCARCNLRGQLVLDGHRACAEGCDLGPASSIRAIGRAWRHLTKARIGRVAAQRSRRAALSMDCRRMHGVPWAY